MLLPKSTVSIIIVFAIVLSLVSFTYPSVAVPSYSTQTIVNTNVRTSVNLYGTTRTEWSRSSFTTTGTLTMQFEWFYPFPNLYCPQFTFTALPGVTYVCWVTSSGIFIISPPGGHAFTTTSTWTSTSTWKVMETGELVHTNYQNIPMYASLGLSQSDFVFIAIFVIIAGGLAIFYGRKGIAKPHQAKMSQFTETKPACVKCGADLPPNSNFCNKCGTKQP